MTYVVALTGGIASGKSTVSQLFNQLGIHLVDTDQIARELVVTDAPAWQKIVAHFGEAILSPDQTLNRRLLRERVFMNPEEKSWLEGLLHPLICDEACQQIQRSATPYCLLVIPLLNQAIRRQYPIDRVVAIHATVQQQKQRLMARDGIADNLATAMIQNQPTEEERLSLADDVINNDETEVLADQVHQLHEQYLMLANAPH